MTSHRPCNFHTRGLEEEECQTFYGLAKNRQSLAVYLFSFCIGFQVFTIPKKNSSWADKLEIDCNILKHDPPKEYYSLSEKMSLPRALQL